jgi:hypothetical protein
MMNMTTLIALLTVLWCGTPEADVRSAPRSEPLTVPGLGEVVIYPPRAAPSQAVPSRVPVLCARGGGEDDSACRNLKGAGIRFVEIGEGHHFSGKYAQLADAILGFAR